MNPIPQGFKLFVIPPQTDRALAWHLVAPSGAVVRLTDQQGVILSQLLGRYGRPVFRNNLIEALWGDDPEGGPLDPTGVIKVQVNRIKKVCRALGMDFECKSNFCHDDKNNGYTLKNLRECKPIGSLPRYYRAPAARLEIQPEELALEDEEIFFGYRVMVNKCYEVA